MTPATLQEIRDILDHVGAPFAAGQLLRHEVDLVADVTLEVEAKGENARVTTRQLQRLRDLKEKTS